MGGGGGTVGGMGDGEGKEARKRRYEGEISAVNIGGGEEKGTRKKREKKKRRSGEIVRNSN